VISRWQ